MKNLNFTLSLIDKLTRPLKGAKASLQAFGKDSEEIFKKIGINGAVVYAAGRSITAFLDPALKMQQALNEASARGVDDTALKQLANGAITHSIKYGKSAEEFIASTGGIRSSISDLTNLELPRYATAVNTLAAGTKSGATDAAAYMGDMYTRFKSTADAMGRVKWAEQLAGQSAYMYEAFALDPAKIRDLMVGSKNTGNAYGVGMTEQLAVLGELSRTMGSESAGAYEQFLKSAVDGGKALGLSFTDANGQLLAMPEILGKLQKKYGKTIEGNLRAQREIEKAFGSGAEVVKTLYNSTDKLNGYIKDLGSNDGMARAAKMAQKMANPVERFNATVKAARIVIGNALLPVLTPLIEKLITAGNQFTRWMRLFPNIAKLIGYITLGLISFAGVVALINIGVAMSALLLRAWRVAVFAVTAVWKTFGAVMWLWNSRALIINKTMKMVRGTIMALSMASRLAGLSFAFMSWPVLLIVGAIALLVVGVIALIKYWDDIKAAISDTAAFKLIMTYVNYVAGVFEWAWSQITGGWKNVCGYFENFSFIDTFNNAVDSIASLFLGLWESIKNQFAGVYNSIVAKLNKIPGVNIELKTISEPAPIPGASGKPLLTGGQVKNNGRNGGLKQSLNSNSSVDNSRNIQTLNIYPASPQDAIDMMEWAKVNAG